VTRILEPLGTCTRFALGIGVGVGVGLACVAAGLPWWAGALLGLLALYLYGSISTNGYLPFTRRWKARRAAGS
jgi:hypothetical protein